MRQIAQLDTATRPRARRGFGWSRREHASGARPGEARPPVLAEVAPLFHLELARARRYDRDLSMIALSAAACDEVIRAMRLFDVVAHTPDGECIIVLMPETTAKGAAAFAMRLLDGGLQDTPRIASFPGDGLTLDALLECIE